MNIKHNYNKLIASYILWFKNYTDEFLASKYCDKKKIMLKIKHTNNVFKLAVKMTRTLKFTDKDIFLALTIALFHDLGRFEQLKQHGSYNDFVSLDHAMLSVKLLRKYKIFDNLQGADKKVIYFAIEQHNKPSIKNSKNTKALMHSRLIRDLDKIDIYRYVVRMYSNKNNSQSISNELGINDCDNVSEKIFNSIKKNELINFRDVRTIADFKILQMFWIFDINFKESLTYIKKNNYIKKIKISIRNNKINYIDDLIAEYLDGIKVSQLL